MSSRTAGASDSSLFERVKAGDADAWRSLSRVFGPVVLGWCRQAGLTAEDAADVTQDVFSAVAASVGRFQRSTPNDSFRGWLYGITRNKIGDHFRRSAQEPRGEGGTDAQARLLQVPEPSASIVPDSDGSPEGTRLIRRALEEVRAQFEPQTWRAFWLTAVEGFRTAEAAAQLDMTPAAVRVAKSRVLYRLRDHLIDPVG